MFDYNQYLNNNNNINNANMLFNNTTPINTMSTNTTCGCNTPIMQGPYNIQNKTYTQFVAQPCNFHTHTINTVIRKKYIVPTYTNSEETVFVDENPCGCNRNRRIF